MIIRLVGLRTGGGRRSYLALVDVGEAAEGVGAVVLY